MLIRSMAELEGAGPGIYVAGEMLGVVSRDVVSPKTGESYKVRDLRMLVDMDVVTVGVDEATAAELESISSHTFIVMNCYHTKSGYFRQASTKS